MANAILRAHWDPVLHTVVFPGLGVPKAQGEFIPVTDASNGGRGGTVFQWQALEEEEFNTDIS